MDEYDLVVDFDLRREVEGELHVRATLHNRSLHDLISWSLKFDLPKSIRAREGTDHAPPDPASRLSTHLDACDQSSR